MNDDAPLYEIQTLMNPRKYTAAQISDAALLAAFLGRGKLVLTMPPEN
jgi:hypothetical protein